MNIGINLVPYAPNQNGGAEVYIQNLILALADHECKANKYILFVTTRGQGKYLPSGENFQEVVLPKWSSRNRVARIIAEQLVLPYYLGKSEIDCIFSNYVSPVLTSVPQVVNIHDMLYKRLPHTIEPTKRLYWSTMVPLSVKRSRRVMTVSQSSARDILEFFPKCSEKLSVTVEGVNRNLLTHCDTKKEIARNLLSFDSPYVMSSATFGKHKNVESLIVAFRYVHKRYPDLHLVLTGGANTQDAVQERARLIALAAQLGLSDQIVFTGYVPDQVQASLYRAAMLYVMPSLYEGFGLSVLEAQYFSVPVICSQASALVEIGGEGVYSVDALSPESLANAIIDLINSPNERARLVECGLQNVKKYTWKKAADDLLFVCQQSVIC